MFYQYILIIISIKQFQQKKVLPLTAPINTEEAFQRELEKEETKREIIASEIALACGPELEEEVRKKIASNRALGIPMQRSKGNSFNNNKMFDGSL
ncbi:hypothetical protein GmHk_17G050221 [Glycine max]|nr:hypothetical protein GmHk_17G050221 [Glycine max]